MATYTLNDAAVAHARSLIDARQYVLDSLWRDASPSTDDENDVVERHGWEEFGRWHLGLVDGAAERTKARHGFVFGDFRRVHRAGLIACETRAGEYRHDAIRRCARELLDYLDDVRA